MTSSTEFRSPAKAKAERANEHLRDLDAAVRSFLDSDPYSVGPEIAPIRVRGINRVALHADRTMLARLSLALN